MVARVVVVGIDGAEASLLTSWAAGGVLPTLASLATRGACGPLGNPMESLPGAIWPEITMGRSAGRIAQFYHPWQLHTGESSLRPLESHEVDPSLYYWASASAAGRRSCVVNQVQTVLVPDFNGAQLIEWSNHDRNFEEASSPASLIDEMRSRYGTHPVRSCDSYGTTLDDRSRLLEDLGRGVKQSTAIFLDLMAREEWDLFSVVFCETHCVGHQFWHFLDPTCVDHIAGAPAALQTAIQDVYREADDGIAAIIEAAGPGATVLVVASHGMGPYTGGPSLVTELIVRMGLSGKSSARQLVPPWAKRWLRRHVPQATASINRATGLATPAAQAVTVPNNRCAAVRLNVLGREPNGSVQAGGEADAILEALRSELLTWRHPSSGEAMVARVQTADEAFGCDHHPDVPDLMVAFRGDLGLLEAADSPRYGRVAATARWEGNTRTGDHTANSALWAVGEGIPAGSDISNGNVVDLAPTVLSLLDVPLPADLDGSPLFASGRARSL